VDFVGEVLLITIPVSHGVSFLFANTEFVRRLLWTKRWPIAISQQTVYHVQY
jgi:hypothetical protein